MIHKAGVFVRIESLANQCLASLQKTQLRSHGSGNREIGEEAGVWKPGEEAWVKSFDLVSTGDIKCAPGQKN